MVSGNRPPTSETVENKQKWRAKDKVIGVGISIRVAEIGRSANAFTVDVRRGVVAVATQSAAQANGFHHGQLRALGGLSLQ